MWARLTKSEALLEIYTKLDKLADSQRDEEDQNIFDAFADSDWWHALQDFCEGLNPNFLNTSQIEQMLKDIQFPLIKQILPFLKDSSYVDINHPQSREAIMHAEREMLEYEAKIITKANGEIKEKPKLESTLAFMKKLSTIKDSISLTPKAIDPQSKQEKKEKKRSFLIINDSETYERTKKEVSIFIKNNKYNKENVIKMLNNFRNILEYEAEVKETPMRPWSSAKERINIKKTTIAIDKIIAYLQGESKENELITTDVIQLLDKKVLNGRVIQILGPKFVSSLQEAPALAINRASLGMSLT